MDNGSESKAIQYILDAWKILLKVIRMQDELFSGDDSRQTQNRKRIKSQFRHLQEIVDRQRCEKTHVDVKEAIAKVPLDIRFCKWTKILSLVPKSIEYTHRLVSVIYTHFPDLEAQLNDVLDATPRKAYACVTPCQSLALLHTLPAVPLRRSFSLPEGSPPKICYITRPDNGSARSSFLPGTPSVSSSMNIHNLNYFQSPPDNFAFKAPEVGKIEARMTILDHEKEDLRWKIGTLKFELSGIQRELYEYRMAVTKLEVEVRLKDYYLKETMKEVQRLGGSKLRPPLTDYQMEDIAACLRDDFHIRLANILDIDLTEIEHDYPIVTCGLREVKVQILRRWREREGEGGTVERLIMGMMNDDSLAGTAKYILDRIFRTF
ncbi:uncharacterized protein LOC144444574 [Glandiceps talaboti]